MALRKLTCCLRMICAGNYKRTCALALPTCRALVSKKRNKEAGSRSTEETVPFFSTKMVPSVSANNLLLSTPRISRSNLWKSRYFFASLLRKGLINSCQDHSIVGWQEEMVVHEAGGSAMAHTQGRMLLLRMGC